MGVKGPITTPHAPNMYSSISTTSRPKTAEVSRDELGGMDKNGILGRGIVETSLVGFLSDSLIKNIVTFPKGKH